MRTNVPVTASVSEMLTTYENWTECSPGSVWFGRHPAIETKAVSPDGSTVFFGALTLTPKTDCPLLCGTLEDLLDGSDGDLPEGAVCLEDDPQCLYYARILGYDAPYFLPDVSREFGLSVLREQLAVLVEWSLGNCWFLRVRAYRSRRNLGRLRTMESAYRFDCPVDAYDIGDLFGNWTGALKRADSLLAAGQTEQVA